MLPELGQEVEDIVCALDKDIQGAAATVATTLRDKGQTVDWYWRVNATRLVLVGKIYRGGRWFRECQGFVSR